MSRSLKPDARAPSPLSALSAATAFVSAYWGERRAAELQVPLVDRRK